MLSFLYVIATLATLATPAAPSSPASPARDPRESFCAVLRSLDRQVRVRLGGDACARRWTPASTFKIPHALIALETGARKSVDEVEKWDGVDRGLAAWNQDLSMRGAVEHSAVWYFQRTARRIGHAGEAAGLHRLHYGNEDAGSEDDLTAFWLDEPLAISADEQVDFLERLVRRTLPFAKRNIDAVDSLLLQTPGQITRAVPVEIDATWDPKRTRLYSKTGSSDRADGTRVRWLVGHLERDGQSFVFASLVTSAHDLSLEAVAQGVRMLVAAGLLEPKLAADGSPRDAPRLRTVELAELQVKDSFDLEAARAWVRPPEVTFALDGGPVIDGDNARLAGFLSNASTQAQRVIVFPAGPFGFFIEPAPGLAERIRPAGQPPLPPPVPPPPQILTLPPMSRVRLQTSLFLPEWRWTKQPRELDWSFLFWNEPKPRGRVPLP